jgi:putative ABC transport system permease protein
MGAGRASLTWRWSLRDLRRRWLLVTAIAGVLALGTGTYAGLGSTAEWRRQSNDASFAALHLHDLRVDLVKGSTVPEGSLDALLAELPDRGVVVAHQERLVLPSQVDASTPDETILVPAELVGVDVTSSGGPIDELWATGGRTLRPGDDRRPIALLEHQFAGLYGLDDTGTLRVSGGTEIRYVGLGAGPQHLLVAGEGGNVFSFGNLAVLYLPLRTAQSITERDGEVNQLVLRLRPGADPATVQEHLSAALGDALPDTGATFTTKADEPAYRMLYEDIETDQQFWNLVALLILAGATFAAFNLISRMVEAQRREIGIGMALGVPRRRLALRPLLVGVQIAVAGAVLGLLVGLALDRLLQRVFESVFPMPEWQTPFQPGVYGRAVAIGVLLPLVATAVPVWRAVRVQPVDAIRTGHLAARGGGWAPLVARLPLPGRVFRQMPVRNLLRTPRRTLLTSLAVAAAITTMVATIGLVDSFADTLDRGEAELGRSARDRLTVELDTFHPSSAPEVTALGAVPEVGEAQARLRLLGRLGGPDRTTTADDIGVIVDLLAWDDAVWTPSLTAGSVDAVRDGGLVLSDKAASDLGVGVGEVVPFEHPVREGTSYRLATSELVVAATHPSPVRNLVYLDLGQASLFELDGLVNVVTVVPAPGRSEADVQRALFEQPAVSSVQSVTATVRVLREALSQFLGILRVAELVVLVLALLIAFNASSISIDERAREHATMLAFGLRTRTVLAMVTVESVLTGLLGTAIGVVAGRGVVRWMMEVQLQRTMPDLGVQGTVSTATIVTAFVLGTVAVGLAPVLASRRVRRVDIPATLRVME